MSLDVAVPAGIRQRRRGFRADVAFVVTYSRGGGGTAEAMALNVSALGVRMFCKEALQVEESLDLEFRLPESEVREAIGKLGRKPAAVTFDVLRVRGTVRSARYDRDRCAVVYGIAFEGLSAEVAEGIHQFVHLTQIRRGS